MKKIYKFLVFIGVIFMILIPLLIMINIILDNLFWSLLLFIMVACNLILIGGACLLMFYGIPAIIALFKTLWQYATKDNINFKATFKEKYTNYKDLTF